MKYLSIVTSSLTLLFTLMMSNCSGKDDFVEIGTLYVSAETKLYKPVLSDTAIEGIQIKYNNEPIWSVIHMNSIESFDYTKGYAYTLKVEKTTLAYPPQDGSNIRYKLLEIITKENQQKGTTEN